MNVLVQTKYGPVRGYENNSIAIWKGIPYAAPPVGEKRFQNPVPPNPWTQPLITNEFSASPMQIQQTLDGLPKKYPVSEDCLYLNIWSPAPDDKKRPVFLWIYGGAYCNGSSVIDIYDGETLAKNEDVVVVTFNYRLGALGFLDLSSWGPSFHCNNGLKDQFAALRWVYENIEAFGGDPHNITLIGQSAGANSVTTLLTIPQARTYIAKAVAMSSYPASTHTKESAARFTTAFLDLLELPASQADTLLTLPAEELVKASHTLATQTSLDSHNEFPFLPIIDGEFLKEFPLIAAQYPSAQKQIPLIMGTCENEGFLYTKTPVPLIPVTQKMVEEFLFYSEGGLHKELLELYGNKTGKYLYSYLGGDLTFRIPTIWYADRYSSHSDTFVYNFEYVSTLLKWLDIYTIHGTDIPFFFHNFEATVSKLGLMLEFNKQPIRELSQRMGHDFAIFARTGKAPWEPYCPQRRGVKVYDTEDSLVHSFLTAEASCWENTEYHKRLFITDRTYHYLEDAYERNEI